MMINSHQLPKSAHDLGRMMSDPIGFILGIDSKEVKKHALCVMCDLYFSCGKEKSSTPEHTIEEDKGCYTGCLSSLEVEYSVEKSLKTCEGTKNLSF